MSGKGDQFLTIRRIPNFDTAITASRGYALTVRAESDSPNLAIMTSEFQQFGAFGGIQEAHAPIVSCDRKQTTVGAKFQGMLPVTLNWHIEDLSASDNIPNLYPVSVACRDAGAVSAEGNAVPVNFKPAKS